MDSKAVQFLAIVLMGIALIPAGAHLFALPNKIGMSQEDYFTAQQIYSGWFLLGLAWLAALVVNLILTIGLRRQRAPFICAGIGFASIAVAFVVFFLWTFPANQATANWTLMPDNWQALRTQWEYSHAANAVIVFIGFCGIVLASLRPGTEMSGGRRDVTPVPAGPASPRPFPRRPG